MSQSTLKLILNIIKSSGMKRLSAINKFTTVMDYKAKDERDKEFLAELISIIDRSHTEWNSYDYGEGFLYQSFPGCDLRGLRDSKFRFDAYQLETYLDKGTYVLDIGCNSGFLSLMIAEYCKAVDGIEYNPYLVNIANLCKNYLNNENANFACMGFDDFAAGRDYDVVLSLANHHTFDEGLRPDFREYMQKIHSMLVNKGVLIFESHPYEFRKPSLTENIESVQDIFEIIDKKETKSYKKLPDNNRLVVWFRAVK